MKRLHFSGGGNAALDALEKDVISVIDQLKSSSPAMNRDHEEDGESGIFLIVDQPDLLLAATGPGKGIGATEMNDWMMNLQQVCVNPQPDYQKGREKCLQKQL